MSGRLPWFRCRPTPLLAEIAGMQADEGYVIIVLFLRILETGGPVLETSRTLARRTGLREQRIVAALEAMLATGKVQRLSDGQRDIAFTHEEIAWQNQRRDEQSKAGKVSAKKRNQIYSAARELEQLEKVQQIKGAPQHPLSARSTIKKKIERKKKKKKKGRSFTVRPSARPLEGGGLHRSPWLTGAPAGAPRHRAAPPHRASSSWKARPRLKLGWSLNVSPARPAFSSQSIKGSEDDFSEQMASPTRLSGRCGMIAPDLFQTSHYPFERRRCEWPSDPLIDWEQIKSLFLTLSPEDQGHCSRLVARYLSLCHRIGSRVGSPAEWIGHEAGQASSRLSAVAYGSSKQRKRRPGLSKGHLPGWPGRGTARARGNACRARRAFDPSAGMAGGFLPLSLPSPRPGARVKCAMDRGQRRSDEHEEIKGKSNQHAQRQTYRRRTPQRSEEQGNG